MTSTIDEKNCEGAFSQLRTDTKKSRLNTNFKASYKLINVASQITSKLNIPAVEPSTKRNRTKKLLYLLHKAMEHDEHSHTATIAKVMAHWARTKIFY